MPHKTHLTNRPRPPEPRTAGGVVAWCWATTLWAARVVVLSIHHPRQASRNFWHLVNEPRGISLLVFIGYIILTWGGQSALTDPPLTITYAAGNVAMTLLSIMLVTGGIIGALTCLPGWNWLERGGVLLAGVATIIYCVLVVWLGQVEAEGNRDLQISIVCFTILMLTARAMWIWDRPYARRREPLATK